MAAPTGSIQPYSTGASYVFVGFAGSVSPQKIRCLGTCEGYPKHERRVDYMQLMNDVSGRRKPMDMSFQGMDATISLDLTLWDEGCMQMLQQFAQLSGGSGLATPGAYQFSDVGSLMGFEQYSVSIWIQYLFRSAAGGPKAVYSALPAGYHYLQCVPFAPDTTEEGAQPMIRSVNFYAWPVCNFSNQQFTLYDNTMSAIQGVPVVGPIAA